MQSAHEPHLPAQPAAVVDDTSSVRDTATGTILTVGDWIVGRAESEGRSREESMEELLNAIARGDLTVIDPVTG